MFFSGISGREEPTAHHQSVAQIGKLSKNFIKKIATIVFYSFFSHMKEDNLNV